MSSPHATGLFRPRSRCRQSHRPLLGLLRLRKGSWGAALASAMKLTRQEAREILGVEVRGCQLQPSRGRRTTRGARCGLAPTQTGLPRLAAHWPVDPSVLKAPVSRRDRSRTPRAATNAAAAAAAIGRFPFRVRAPAALLLIYR